MSKTAERTQAKISSDFANGQAKRPQTKAEPFPIRCLKAAASLRITVFLMALSILLIFFGTLAQVDQGIGTVLHAYFRTWLAWIPWQVFVRFGQVFFHVSQDTQVSGSFPFPGGWLLGGLLLANLLAAHTVRFKVSWKRSGILVLHAGVVVMMLGELVTGLFAVESRMTIALNETVGFTDVNSPPMFGGSARELALIDSSEPGKDHVVVIPASKLKPGNTISDPQLPADVEVVEYLPNTSLVERGPQNNGVVMNVEGEAFAIVPRSQENGVDPGGREDVPAVRVTFKDKKNHDSLGTYLLSPWLYPNLTLRQFEFLPQHLQVDGKKYALSFRPKRDYKPFTLQLTDFQHGKYPGTEIPKDFVSTVHIVNPETKEDRGGIKISMNNPLVYNGETFYQSGYFQNDGGTVLQVVHNPGSQMPYWACGMVALGMLVHFGLHLVAFLRSRRSFDIGSLGPLDILTRRGLLTVLIALFTSKPKNPTTLDRSGWAWVVPIAALLFFVIYLCNVIVPVGPKSKMHFAEAGKIPCQDSGRIKPLDTLARTSLMVISNRSTFVDDKKNEHSALEWLLDVMAGGDPLSKENPASKYKVFRIENVQLVDFLHLPHRPGSWRYSIAELAQQDNFDALEREAKRAVKLDEKKLDLFDTKLLELRRHLDLYYGFAHLQAPGIVPADSADGKWQSLVQAEQEIRETALMRLEQIAAGQGLNRQQLKNLPMAKLVAMFEPELKKAREEGPPEAKAMLAILTAHGDNDPERFNEAVDGYLGHADASASCDMKRVRTEAFFDDLAPFYQCIVLYVIVFALAFVGLLLTAFTDIAGQILCRTAFWLALFTLLLNSWALITRMYLQGRPPVTNLYSAAVWIAWGCVLLGLILEHLYRNGIGTVVAAVSGFLSMLLAHHLAGSGDTLQMMEAVLDTNFWLATHVTIVTFGYVATVVAGIIGLIYVILGVVTPALDRDMNKVLSQMIYGVLCFATFLSFTGTVLGGLWADYSWGRFWGWDPKENGALIIVLWNALILHARWAGLVKQRGVAVLSIVGIMVTGWSFIGTNQLGVGLHAYGFNNTLATILVWTWFTCLGLIGMGLVPRQRWVSNRL